MDKQELSKKERYLLKKERKRQKYLRLVRQEKIKKAASIMGIVAIAGILIIGAGRLTIGAIRNFSSEEETQAQGMPKIEISPAEYDAGTVSMSKELVKHTYEIKNNGDGTLKIDKIWTSCMCTTAILKVGDKESPKFGMHENPLFWSQEISPGETGYLEMTFDPAFHGPSGVGSATRVVYLSTNDPQSKRVEVGLVTNVTL